MIRLFNFWLYTYSIVSCTKNHKRYVKFSYIEDKNHLGAQSKKEKKLDKSNEREMDQPNVSFNLIPIQVSKQFL